VPDARRGVGDRPGRVDRGNLEPGAWATEDSTDEPTDGRTDGRTDGIDGRMDARCYNRCLVPTYLLPRADLYLPVLSLGL
jgi:hypothetical protein